MWGKEEGRGRSTYEPLDLKLVSVKLVGLGRALPTLSLGFWKSVFFEDLLRAEEPIARWARKGGQGTACVAQPRPLGLKPEHAGSVEFKIAFLHTSRDVCSPGVGILVD